MNLATTIEDTLKNAIQRVEFRSKLTGDIGMSRPLAPGPGGKVDPKTVPSTPDPASPQSRFVRWLQPSIVVGYTGGTITYAPYGLPTASYAPYAIIGLTALGVAAAYGVVRFLFD